MNWKETVLSQERIHYFAISCYEADLSAAEALMTVAEAQAEASFRAGIREVVGWIEQNKLYALVPCPQELVIMWDNWQAKLMEWHVKEVT